MCVVPVSVLVHLVEGVGRLRGKGRTGMGCSQLWGGCVLGRIVGVRVVRFCRCR